MSASTTEVWTNTKRVRTVSHMAYVANRHIDQLYLPQFEQFGLHLQSNDTVTHAQTVNEIGAGSAWVMPISNTCLIMEHVVTPAHDMRLLEQTFEPYACVSEMNAETLSCMPENGIVPGSLAERSSHEGAGKVCTFVQESLHDQYSPLKAGVTYRSRSVLFLSGFFDDLERQRPREFSGLFKAFNEAWSEEAIDTMACALRQFSYPRALQPAAHLHASSIVNTMVAELARAHATEIGAAQAEGSRVSSQLAAQAIALIERAIDSGQHIGVDETAARLYVSRSKLCATFKHETGEGLAAYARRRRIERAHELLADSGLSIAEIAVQLGYQRQSAFSQAFKQACGISPTAWREMHS